MALRSGEDAVALTLADLRRRTAIQWLIAHLDHVESGKLRDPRLVVRSRVGQRSAGLADDDEPKRG